MATTTSAQQIIRNGPLDRSEIPEQYWELVDRYRPELLSQARAITGSAEDAEDVVQETFCEAFRDPQKLADAESIGARLRLINRNNALNRIRDRRRASSRILKKQECDPETLFTTGGFNVLELKEAVGKALEILPETQRLVVEMRYFQHLSLKEISARTKMPIGTIGRTLSEASMSLFEKLRAQLGSAPSTTASTQEVPPVEGQ